MKLRNAMRLELDETIDTAYRSSSFEPASASQGVSLSATSFSSRGFVYQPIYVRADGAVQSPFPCETMSMSIGYAVNNCLLGKGYSYKFQLTTGNRCAGGVVQFFSDRLCNNFVGSNNLENFANRCLPVKNTTYVGLNAYQQIQCNTLGIPIVPVSSVTGETFSNNACSGDPIEYTSYATDLCMALFGYVGAVFNCEGGVPKFITYGSNTCTAGVTTSTVYPSVCSAGSTYTWPLYPADDDYLPPAYTPPSVSSTPYPTQISPIRSTIQYCTNNRPTMMPAANPTAFPTATSAVTVDFDVVQILIGIDAYLFDYNPLNSISVRTTIASTMTGVATADVLDLRVSDYSATVRVNRVVGMRGSISRAGENSPNFTHAEPVEKASILHTVTPHATTLVTGVTMYYTIRTRSVYTADQLFFELEKAVTSGAFNQNLYTDAQINDAVRLYGCTSDTVSRVREKDTFLSTAQIAGIVAGCVVGVIVIIGGFVFYCTSK
eukprot:gene17493-19931_t